MIFRIVPRQRLFECSANAPASDSELEPQITSPGASLVNVESESETTSVALLRLLLERVIARPLYVTEQALEADASV